MSLVKPKQRLARHAAHKGVSAVLIAGIGLMLLAVLGISVYVGTVAYIQGEMTEMANVAAGAAARSLYDDFADKPIYSEGKALARGNAAFQEMLKSSTTLKAFKPAVDIHPLGNETIEAVVLAQVKVPLFSALGLSPFLVEAKSSAIYAQNDVSSRLEPMHMQGTKNPVGNNPAINTHIDIPLDLPVFNASGPEIYINTEPVSSPPGFHGVVVYVCKNDDSCYDVGKGAYPYKRGVVIQRGSKYVLYGQFFIDLEHTDIEKGVKIRIDDDIVQDRYLAAEVGMHTKGTRVLELVPSDTVPVQVRTMHHAIMCFQSNCQRPNNFVAGATPYAEWMP